MSDAETPAVLDETARQAPAAWRVLERFLGLATAVVLTAMMFLTGADVIARYFLNAPIKGAFELTEILLVCLVFLAMPLAMLSNAHVEVELWEPKSALGESIRAVIGGLSAFLVFGGLAWQLVDHASRLASYGSVSNSLQIPLDKVAWLAACGCAIGAAIALCQIVQNIRAKQ
ncbi:MAG: TRAP transporter small permease [Paracoccus sp. (in: a-proteobacteria)]